MLDGRFRRLVGAALLFRVKMRKSRIEHIGSVVPPRAAERGTVLITLGDYQ
jgi:hypothetical protein